MLLGQTLCSFKHPIQFRNVNIVLFKDVVIASINKVV